MKVRLRNPDRRLELSGRRRVRDILAELSIDPDTVLVIREKTLLTRDEWVGEADEVELRPVISGGAGGRRGQVPRCRRCREPAVVEVRRHNASFCRPCFLHHVGTQVGRAIEDHDMLRPEDRIMVAVSGGKDSLAAGMYLGLGIGGYSDRSRSAVEAFAGERDAELILVDLREAYGFDIPTAGAKGSRSTCGVCGLSKRYVFNRVALDRGFDVVATGHNLDDEAATLLGNTLRWSTEYMARQFPVLPAREGMVKKVKPLYRISERETAAYAFLRDIEYVIEECPLVAGNTQLRYKDAMNRLEAGSPGTKASFYLGFVERGSKLMGSVPPADLVPCERCGQPTTGRFCAFCRAVAQVRGLRLVAPPSAAEVEHEEVEQADRQTAAELSEEVLPAEIYGR